MYGLGAKRVLGTNYVQDIVVGCEQCAARGRLVWLLCANPMRLGCGGCMACVWTSPATSAQHQVVHLVYAILGSSEVKIMVCFLLCTRGDAIYAVAGVVRPFDHKGSWI